MVLQRLVGRTTETATIERTLSELARGAFGALQVTGEPGIGKTRLLAELADQAHAQGVLVLRGSASELERALPFWVFVDALDDYLQGLPTGRLQSLQDEVLAELSTIFPSLTPVGRGLKVASQHERYRSHRAVRELLGVLAQTQPSGARS